MKCPNCKTENEYNDRYCRICGNELLIYNESEPKQNSPIIIFFIVGIPLLVIIFLFCLGIESYKVYLGKSKIFKKYEKTTAVLDNYVNCDYEYQLYKCNGLYTYNVNGKEYEIRAGKKAEIGYIEEAILVYYNAKNPKEASTIAPYTDEEDKLLKRIFLIISMVAFMCILKVLNQAFKIIKKYRR